MRSFAGAVALALLTIGAGCPVNRSDVDVTEEVAEWSTEVFLRAGEDVEVDDGRLRVAIPVFEPGNRVAFVTVHLQKSTGEEDLKRIKVVRNTDLSSAVEVAPYQAQVMGFPGVDSARLLITRR